jgi:phage gp36-like protein
MSYCSLDDIEAPEEDLIQLTDDAGLGVTDEAIVAKAVRHADELIDGFLRGRYLLPLSPVPGLLVSLAATIVLRRLYARRATTKVPESLQDDYKNALKILENIQKGTVTLGVGIPDTIVTASAGGMSVAPERVFDRTSLTNY